jgi:hypothetical protein
MKIGTFSENLIGKMSKDVSVMLNDSDSEWHANALYAINQMSGKGEWGIIHEPWFEKCNNVSAMIGFVAGVTVVGAAIGIKKIVNKLADEDEHS